MDMEANIPFVNAPECESLGFANSVDAYRQFSGPAVLAGKRVVSNEMGAVEFKAYQYPIPELLWSVNRAVAGGVNQMVFHGQSYTGDYYATTWPGYTAFSYLFSELYSNKQPAWEHCFADAVNYIARIQYTQQTGRLRTDVAVYNKQSATNTSFAPVYADDDLLRYGYTYSYLSPDNFNLSQAYVQNGVLAPQGPGHRAFVIPSTSNLTLAATEKLQQYADAGLPIILSGRDPGYYASGDGSGKDAVEKGIASLKKLPNVYSVPAGEVANQLSALGIRPQIQIQTNGTWYTTWREDVRTGVDYAFIFSDINASVGKIDIASTKIPYLLNPWTGEGSLLLEYQQDENSTVIPLTLAGNQTVVIAFREQANNTLLHATQLPSTVLGYSYSENEGFVLHVSAGPFDKPSQVSDGRTISNLSSAPAPSFVLSTWTLTAEHWEAPSNLSDAATIAVKHNTTHQLTSPLVSWTDIPGLANASGVGYYTTTMTWPPTSAGAADGAYLIFTSKILHAVKVYINDQLLPPVDYAAAPVKADIGKYLKTGDNRILVVVPTTMWNYLRSILDELQNAGLPPLLTVVGDVPGQTENGLLGRVEVVPYVNLKVT